MKAKTKARRRLSATASALVVCVCLLMGAAAAQADVITDNDIIALAGSENRVHSGNGTLDLILFHDAMAGSGNTSGAFDADDAYIDMPKGSSAGNSTAIASYITSVGELRQFYILNFPDGQGGSTITDLLLIVDLNQVTGTDVILDNLTVVRDYDLIFGDSRDDPASNDIDSDTQALTGAGFTGGTVLASLDTSPKILALVRQGAGFADYAIRLGIDPFDSAFADDTPILFHWQSHGHDSGGESIFFSGSVSGFNHVPEPATLSLLALGGLVALLIRRRK